MLYLIPVPISDNTQTISIQSQYILPNIKKFIVENVKTARRMLRKMDYQLNFDEEVQFFEMDKHQKNQDISIVKAWLLSDEDIGLMSEAGLPCIADPGSEFVALAHQLKVKVVPLSGPSSIIMALIASGFNGQNFAFVGYLPIDKNSRIQKIKQLETLSATQTQLFMDTPYRNKELFLDLITHLQSHTKLSIALDISGSDQFIQSMTVKEWSKNDQLPDLHKIPCIFGMSRG
jgi:16S rRNA (cytidine1402-2'-O)-methyltransferase